MVDLEAIWAEYEDTDLGEEPVAADRRLHANRVIAALLRMSQLFPEKDNVLGGVDDMVAGIWFNVEPQDVAARATEEDIRDLFSCGVGFEVDDDYLYLIVD